MQTKTDKRKYQSIYGSGYASASQYVTEQLCIHVAKAQYKSLPDNFWNLPEWQKLFKSQIPAAVKLLQRYSVQAIILALNDYRAKKVTSLRAPFFKKYIEEYQTKIDNHKRDITIAKHSDTLRQPLNKGGILQKIEAIDEYNR